MGVEKMVDEFIAGPMQKWDREGMVACISYVLSRMRCDRCRFMERECAYYDAIEADSRVDELEPFGCIHFEEQADD